MLQIKAHTMQAQTFIEMKRYQEAMSQILLLRSITRNGNLGDDLELEILYCTFKFEECREKVLAS